MLGLKQRLKAIPRVGRITVISNMRVHYDFRNYVYLRETYMYLHEKLYKEICEENYCLYKELVRNINADYNRCIAILNLKENSISEIRYNVHKILSIIYYLDKNAELVYLCKCVLLYDKKTTKYETYQIPIKNITNYDFSYILY